MTPTSKPEHWWAYQNAIVLQNHSLLTLGGQLRDWPLIPNSFSKSGWRKLNTFAGRCMCVTFLTCQEILYLCLSAPNSSLSGSLRPKDKVHSPPWFQLFKHCRYDLCVCVFFFSLLLSFSSGSFPYYCLPFVYWAFFRETKGNRLSLHSKQIDRSTHPHYKCAAWHFNQSSLPESERAETAQRVRRTIKEAYQSATWDGLLFSPKSPEWFSKCGPGTSRISITWALAINANSRPHPRLTESETLEGPFCCASFHFY